MGVQVRDLAGGRGKGRHAPCGSRGTNDAGQGDLDCVGGWTPRCLFPQHYLWEKSGDKADGPDARLHTVRLPLGCPRASPPPTPKI